MPCAASSACTLWYSSDDSSNAFEGIQPAFRQVPPNAGVPSGFFHSSMKATLSLFCPARMAGGITCRAAADDDDVESVGVSHGSTRRVSLFGEQAQPPGD